MKKENIVNISRRSFLKQLGIATGGVVLASYFSGCSLFEQSDGKIVLDPDLFIHMQKDGHITLVVARSEMGQGIRTAMSSIIADELDADWQYIKVKQAEGDAKFENQNTDGSRSVRTFFEPMRELGANMRALLIKAAALQWEVKEEECTAENHYVLHTPTNKKVFYGELVEATATLEPIKGAPLKDPKDFKYIGKELKSVDRKDFTRGTATFGIDVRVPNMKFAVIQRCPVTFGTVKTLDKTQALSIKGVEKVISLERIEKPFGILGGVAVVATNSWAAIQGRSNLQIEWEYGDNEAYDSRKFKQQLLASVAETGEEAKKKGDVDKAFEEAETTIEANYYLPHLVHAPMEVPNATAYVHDGKCEVWAPVQDPQTARQEVADFLETDIENVTINVTFLGGGFGRKSKPDFVVEAVAVAQQLDTPVQVLWTREDDIQHSYYHTVNAQYLKGSLDANGKVTGWLHRTTFPSISSTFEPGSDTPDKWELGQGVTYNGFEIENVLCEHGKADAMVRIGWLRSVCDLFHSFGLNVFADELAYAAKKDPVEFLLELIGSDRQEDFGRSTLFDSQRLKNVLQRVAKNANWGKDLPQGHGQGVTVHYSFQSYVASVVEVSVIDERLKVLKVHTAIDCGRAINRDSIKAQMEGSAIFGLSLVKYGEITAKDGRIEQSNFDSYQMARMPEAPEVYVDIIDSDDVPTGVGEPGVPVIAPAIINAIYSATGKRYRELPLTDLS